MTRSRILGLAVLLLFAIVPMACLTTRMDTPAASGQQVSNVPATVAKRAEANEVTCKMFLLGDLAEDANHAKWIVDTIPTVIQPGSWDQRKGTAENRSISYFAPGKVLVVYHTVTVQAKVDEFLKSLKHASAQVTRPVPNTPAVQQAQFVPGGNPPPPMSTPGYPVAVPLQQPKHLFHFIIRYEGEGLLDSNVVNFVKAMQAAGNSDLGMFKVNQPSPDAVASYSSGSSQPIPQTGSTPPVYSPPQAVQPVPPPPTSQPAPSANPPPPTGPSPKTPPPSQPVPPPSASPPASPAGPVPTLDEAPTNPPE